MPQLEWVKKFVKDGTDLVPHLPLYHCLQTAQFKPNHRSGLPYHHIKFSDMNSLDASSPVHNCKNILSSYNSCLEECSLLRKNSLFCPLFEESIICTVKCIVDLHPKVSMSVYNLYFLSLDGDRGWKFLILLSPPPTPWSY